MCVMYRNKKSDRGPNLQQRSASGLVVVHNTEHRTEYTTLALGFKNGSHKRFSWSLITITPLQAPVISNSLFQTSKVFVPQDTTGHLLEVLWSPCLETSQLFWQLEVNLHNIRQVLFNVMADRCMSAQSDVTCCAEGN